MPFSLNLKNRQKVKRMPTIVMTLKPMLKPMLMRVPMKILKMTLLVILFDAMAQTVK